MNNFGLIGKSIKHSISPLLHQEISKIYNFPMNYVLFEVENKETLQAKLNLIYEKKINGVNVTIPYKEDVISFLHKLSSSAKKIKAVNTIHMKDNYLYGDNTDYDGFLGLLKFNQIDLNFKKIIILGTGGASKAVQKVLEDLGFNFLLVTRFLESTKNSVRMVTYEMLKDIQYEVIINTTPVGMYPLMDESPLKEEFVKEKLVIDLIYNPEKTKLMTYAKESYNGIDMLIIQAIKAQSIWQNKELKITEEIMHILRGKCYEFLRNAF